MTKDWTLGSTSVRYETGGRGAGTISTGHGDHGGVSYGAYQLSSRAGTLREYLAQSRYAEHFAGLTPATPEFNARWKELARTDPGFAADQHDFIHASHYQAERDRLKARGIDLSDRGPAVQDALWSTSVQLRTLTPGIVEKGLKEKFGSRYRLDQLSDRDIVEAIQDYKIQHTRRLFRSSPDAWEGLLNRARREKEDLVALAEGREPARGAQAAPARRAEVERAQAALNALGIGDGDGSPLDVDGRLGPRSREALAAFQRERGLDGDGGLNAATLAALDAALAKHAAPPQHPPQLDQPGHRDHRLYLQAVAGLEKLDAAAGFGTRERLERAAAVMAYEARIGGLQRIDRIVQSADGQRLFAIEGDPRDPSHQRAVADKAQASAQPIAQTTRALEQDAPAPAPRPQPVAPQPTAPMQA
ncbi:peptidoglycan-binding domain-containing protein [Lysobacter enzymogenes]|uniref:peptidoglycan-binding domain-containing protein n=1 Tax=Lysobacter enzymogenes TaxID=69 RepID=UPI002263BAEB|nr:peptidoglycan-binding domain-containing protein [Lysobacter enzymogenes]UZW58859.1 peptidoglycan-binding protein [Lysobacter enzymogenes]